MFVIAIKKRGRYKRTNIRFSSRYNAEKWKRNWDRINTGMECCICLAYKGDKT